MIDNTKVDNKVDIANAFNEYFMNIGEKLAGDIHYTGSLSFENYQRKINFLFLKSLKSKLKQ